MTLHEHSRNFQHPEQERGFDRNPRMAALLGSAGLTAVDLQLFDRLYQQDHVVFVHGSIMADRITPHSDVDFTVIGEINGIPQDLRETLMPGFTAADESHQIDYVSTSMMSQDGRKMSLHVSDPVFRDAQPSLGKPYSSEYRPGMHAKKGPRKYFLPGTTRDGNVRLVNFLCESEHIGDEGGTVTDIPQTGKLVVKGKSVLVDGKEKANITADETIHVQADGSESLASFSDAEEIMILGLEFDKMQSDTSLYNDPDAEARFVVNPLARSMEVMGEFTKTDPAVITNRLFGELAKYWGKVKPNKPR